MDRGVLIVDLSRQRMTLDTINHLLHLAWTRQLKKFITQMAWGHNNPRYPVTPVRVMTRMSTHRYQQHHHKATTTNHHRHTDDVVSTVTYGHQGNRVVMGTGGGGGGAKQIITCCPSMHMALRVPANHGYELLLSDGTNALKIVHEEWDRLQRLSESIRKGQYRGITGAMIQTILVIGHGVPLMALQFMYHALQFDERALQACRVGVADAAAQRLRKITGSITHTPQRRIVFVSTADPVTATAIVSDCDPASTLVVSIALSGMEETGLATKTIKSWLVNTLQSANRKTDAILAKHMMLVTGNDRIINAINKPESVHCIPDFTRCEAFSTFSAATLLPLSIVFGWDIVKVILDGAHAMDNHFVDTNPRHNIPVLLALTDVWNDILLPRSNVRLVTPFSEALGAYPAFVAALEAQTCSRGAPGSPPPSSYQPSATAMVVNTGIAGGYDRSVYQRTGSVNSELIAVLDNQISFNTARHMDVQYATSDAIVCSLFAHADELAFGTNVSMDPGSSLVGGGKSLHSALPPEVDGNRPSTVLLVEKLDAFACGQLVTLAEHRAAVKAHIYCLDPFVEDVGSSLRMARSEVLKQELATLQKQTDSPLADGTIPMATKTLLEHYANVTRETRLQQSG